VVSFQGRWHRITDAGLNPLPVQRPIPIWLGAGGSASPAPLERVLRRIARLADGWFPNFGPDEGGRELVARVRGYMADVGRDPSALGLEGRVRIAGKQPEDWADEVKGWQDLGASHITVEARRGGLTGVDAHVEAIRRFKEALQID
jgi:alkanesulfonate monooxygenase SsuD/methylene tetrahydromethanopterin reductase-like flavin-dependent oxidoreductase (luciferase family)